MFARIEVATKPEYADPSALSFLRRVELAHPEIRKKIRWARMLDIYWLDLPVPREELISSISDIFWDPVLQMIFSGNLIPSAAGKTGGMQDLMEYAQFRPGKFWALERRFRGGVTDNVGRTAMEAFEIVFAKKFPEARASSGALLLCEGPELNEDLLAVVARDVFCNDLIETWTIIPEQQLKKSDRFHQEQVKRDLPKVLIRTSEEVETVTLQSLAETELEKLSKENLWALTVAEMKAIQTHYSKKAHKESRIAKGLPADPTDVEMEVLAQTWSEHCKHKIFGAKIFYEEKDGKSKTIDGLFKNTIAGTTSVLPKPWLLSVFSDNAGIVAFDSEDAVCIKVETHNSPSALDPYGGALTGIVGVNRDILGCGLGAKPIFNTDVFCVAPPDYSQTLPDRILHPRRILDGVRRGVEHGGNKSGIPTVNGALVFDERYLGKPLIYCGTGGIMPRVSAGRKCETKEIQPGDAICMIGGRIGKDGIHGATFSSLALDQNSPSSAVQLGDPITQKRVADFILEARELGLYRAITDNGAGGLSSSVGELARLSGGAKMDVGLAKTKYPGLKPYELVVSESQERMTLAVSQEHLASFTELAEHRGVEVSCLGEFTSSGSFEIFFHGKRVADLNLEFLHGGCPKLEMKAYWSEPPAPSFAKSAQDERSFELDGAKTLIELMGRPNIASKEWMIRQYDHEVQGMSVIKPLHTITSATQTMSGPNDAAVLKPKPSSDAGIVVGCGINPKLSDIDAYLMAQSAVDEAVRNVLCVGAEFGTEESVLALVDNFCWPDPVNDPAKAAALVRACLGLKDAALALSTPLISGKDSMKNDYRGKKDGSDVVISVPPTLLMTALGRMVDVRYARSADFKSVGDWIYLIGGKQIGLIGSEYHAIYPTLPQGTWLAQPDWEMAKRIYSWLGGASGKNQDKLRSLHDVSEGGTLVALCESLLARNLGATIEIPASRNPWEFCYGEGFHTFVASISESNAPLVEAEWEILGVPFTRIGVLTPQEKLEVSLEGKLMWSVSTRQIQAAWAKEGYWE